MKQQVRQPQQERSIETKNKILRASLELFGEIGYFKTNTAQIAKRAEVSTGIVYGYFRGKRDILIQIVDEYTANLYAPILALFDGGKGEIEREGFFARLLDIAVASHKKHEKLHEALQAMQHSDAEVKARFLESEDNMTKTVAARLNALGYQIPSVLEKVHIAINLLQSFAHESVYDKHAYIDYDAMRREVILCLSALFLPHARQPQT